MLLRFLHGLGQGDGNLAQAGGDQKTRDELRVLLVNTDPDADYEVQRGDRIAQLVVQRVEHAEFTPVATLEDSARGTGGFGHTGR